MKLINFFPCILAYYVKRQDFFKIFFKFFWSRYGAGTGTVTGHVSEPDRNWN